MKIKKLSFNFKKIDWFLLITICLLVVLGLILLYSVALGSQTEQSILNLQKQIVFFVFGFVLAFLIGLFFDYRFLSKVSLLLYVLGIILLVLVLIFGRNIRGTTGWFDFGYFSFQPVELVKIFLIVFLAKFFADWAKYIGQFRYLILSSLGVILMMALVALQPDFGSALLLFIIWLGLILLTGLKKKYLFALTGLFLISALVLWFFVFQSYQKERIEVFLNPAIDPLGSGYNITQSIIAIGSGQLFGKGLSFGSQSQLKFLPESQTDFIFAVLAEELGFAGIVFLFLVFAFLFYRLMKSAKDVQDNFASYLIISVLILFFAQLVINIGGNLGLMPITGITLPFVSYGGSSLIANMVLIGLVISIGVRNK